MKVIFTAVWDVPDHIARPWVVHVNHLWIKPGDQPTAVANVICHAPPGYQPEVHIELAKEPS